MHIMVLIRIQDVAGLYLIIFRFSPAKLPRDLRQDDVMGLHALQDAITILFSFKRLGAVEEQFCKDVDSWLSTLVGIHQRYINLKILPYA